MQMSSVMDHKSLASERIEIHVESMSLVDEE